MHADADKHFNSSSEAGYEERFTGLYNIMIRVIYENKRLNRE